MMRLDLRRLRPGREKGMNWERKRQVDQKPEEGNNKKRTILLFSMKKYHIDLFVHQNTYKTVLVMVYFSSVYGARDTNGYVFGVLHRNEYRARCL